MSGAREGVARAAVMFVVAIVVAGCGQSSPPGRTTSGPAPAAMCAGGSPALAAYDRGTGAFKWSACAADTAVRRYVLAVTDDAVFVDVASRNETIVAYDAGTGAVLPDGGPADQRPALPDRSGRTPAVVADGVRLQGGQGDPTSALDDATGDTLWTHPGSPVYDDVWAVGDGAVFVATQTELVAYELRSGATRWSNRLDPASESWPWLVDGNELFTIWSDLAVVSTRNGRTIWRTAYPRVPFPRMTGVGATTGTVFVTFSTVQSGGD